MCVLRRVTSEADAVLTQRRSNHHITDATRDACSVNPALHRDATRVARGVDHTEAPQESDAISH